MIIAAVVLMLCGAGFFVAGAATVGFDFSKMNTAGESVSEEYTIKENFSKIAVDVSTTDIEFAVSDSNDVKVVCNEKEHVKHSVKVADDTLKITLEDNRKWYERIYFSGFSDVKVTIYLPKDMAKLKGVLIETSTGDVKMDDLTIAGDLTIKGSTGDRVLNNISVDGKFTLETSTGDLKADNISAASASLEGSTSDFILNRFVVAGDFTSDTSTGDVKMTLSDAATVKINTSTGDVVCSFLTEKNIKADTSTGRVSLPGNITSGGECRIDTSTGNITVTYEK
jgi:DUF4097 and DUF4098 domain-containing protein YvlB